MKSIRAITPLGLFTALGLSIALIAGPVAFAAETSAPTPEILQKIQSANTPADHEALAKYYQDEAASAKAAEQLHRKMGQGYQNYQKGGMNMYGHCVSISKMQASLAAEYIKMADEHKKLAK
jgi:hypothetical protein